MKTWLREEQDMWRKKLEKTAQDMLELLLENQKLNKTSHQYAIDRCGLPLDFAAGKPGNEAVDQEYFDAQFESIKFILAYIPVKNMGHI